jgi:NO-binding membrane sensor protein with MHYT domain
MHYLGMWALEVPGRVTWSPDLVFASIVLGMIFGLCRTRGCGALCGPEGNVVAALLLTLAIVSHHFTAMGAAEIVPDPTRASDPVSLSASFLAVTIAGVALTVLGMSLVGVMMRIAALPPNPQIRRK